MTSVRFTDVQARPTEFLDLTRVTLDEFQQLVPPFEAAFQAHLAAWRLDGKPRTPRRFTVYKNCPLIFKRRHRLQFKPGYPEINHRCKRSFHLETTGREGAEAYQGLIFRPLPRSQ